MCTYQHASYEDHQAIAHLHARSWQLHYKGIFDDHYLDIVIFEERLKFWEERLRNPPEGQIIFTAKEDGKLLGFICSVFNEDSEFGSLVDNIHVTFERKGEGIGKRLLHDTAKVLYQKSGELPMYLWVLVQNKRAIDFYIALGGKNVECTDHPIPGGTAKVFRFVWKDLSLFS